jgi:replicative DNA helicase
MDEDGNSLVGKAELVIAKQRNGPTGVVNLFFHQAYTRFDELAKEPGDSRDGQRSDVADSVEEPF